jgi:hypothetical protein
MDALHYERFFMGLWFCVIASLFWGSRSVGAAENPCPDDQERMDRILFRLGTNQATLFGNLLKQDSFVELRLDGNGILSLQNMRPGLGLPYSFSKVEAHVLNARGVMDEEYIWPPDGACTMRSLFPGDKVKLFEIPKEIFHGEDGQRLEVFVYSMGS